MGACNKKSIFNVHNSKVISEKMEIKVSDLPNVINKNILET